MPFGSTENVPCRLESYWNLSGPIWSSENRAVQGQETTPYQLFCSSHASRPHPYCHFRVSLDCKINSTKIYLVAYCERFGRELPLQATYLSPLSKLTVLCPQNYE